MSKKTTPASKSILPDPIHSLENTAKSEVKNFRKFIEDQNVIGIAVGLAVGASASTLATSLVNNLILDPIAYIFGSSEGLRGLSFVMNFKTSQPPTTFNYGTFLADLVNFFIIALVFYYIIRFFKLDKKTAPKK